MKHIVKKLQLSLYTRRELPEDYRDLLKEAEKAAKGSYSPYSHFPVGAALLLDNQEVISGSNQENAAYPSGLCAERTALFYYGAHAGTHKIKALAVFVEKLKGDYPYPCGSCLQVMAEFQHRQNQAFDILLFNKDGDEVLLSHGIENLFPFAFKKDHLLK